MNAPAPANIPDPFEWDTADRMRKALRASGVRPGEMAAYLGVGHNTVSTWINGKIEPSVQTLRLWALRTGASLEWLHHGDADTPCDFHLVRVTSPQASAKVYKMHYKPEHELPVNRGA